MTKQTINVGTANKGDGDPLRNAFVKINNNFDELYATTGADVQIPSQATHNGKFLTTNGATLSWATTATNELVNGSHTLSLGSDGKLTFPETGTINNTAATSDSFQATTGTGISGDTKEFVVGGDVDTITTEWTATGGGIVGTAAILNVTVGLSFTFVQFNQSFTASGPITFTSGAGITTLELTPDGTTTWTLGSDGKLQLPLGGDIVDSTGTSVLAVLDGGDASTTF